jgi:hypothetical protein
MDHRRSRKRRRRNSPSPSPPVQRPKKRTTYNDSKLTQEKRLVHKKFIALVQQRVEGDLFFLSLEGRKMRSADAFLRSLPNIKRFHNCEWDLDVYGSQLKKVRTLKAQYPNVDIMPIFANINDILKKKGMAPATNVYFLDYMGTIWGTQVDRDGGGSPLEGLDYALRNARDAEFKQVVLGLTFSQRGRKPTQFEYPAGWKPQFPWRKNQRAIVQANAITVALTHGYTTEVMEAFNYHSMVFIQFLFVAKK